MKKNKIKQGILYLCYCPEWCEEEYMIAKWDGNKFDYSGCPNDDFDSYITSFYPLNENSIDLNIYERD